MNRSYLAVSVGLLILSGSQSFAAPESKPDVTELSRRIDILSTELDRLRIGDVAAAPDRPQAGLGAAASKVYRTQRGFSLGGYGETLYENFSATRRGGQPSNAIDRMDLLRGVLYVGNRFNESFVFNSEIEFEHASTERGGAVSVEFAFLDYAMSPQASFRVGLLLIPMGFTNELHEPTAFLGAKRSDVETRILPSTWGENGIGVYGDVGPITYRSYLVTGLNASAFDAEEGIREGRQGGAEANADTFASVTRVDWTAVPGLIAGGSVYLGTASTEQAANRGGGMHLPVQIYEGHAEWRHRGWELRVLGAFTSIGKAGELSTAKNLAPSQGIGENQRGYYVQAGYDVLSQGGGASLVPFVRWDDLNTQALVASGFTPDPANRERIFTVGASFKPIDYIVIKPDYQLRLQGDGSGVNQFNLAFGYVF